jgi:hypothetical protein
MTDWVNTRAADILRAEGLVPLPRMWCTPEERSQVIAMCEKHQDRVVSARRRHKEEEEAWKTRK